MRLTKIENGEMQFSGDITDRAFMREVLMKLFALEQAQEEKKMIMLPIGVGQPCYTIRSSSDCIYHYDCRNDKEYICEEGTRCRYELIEKFVTETKFQLPMLLKYGETVFATREEAEAAK